MTDKFYTLADLVATGLPMFASCVVADVEIGQPYLQPSVISRWDWQDRSDQYIYWDRVHTPLSGWKQIKYVVKVCVQQTTASGTAEPLKKDLSNLPPRSEMGNPID